MQKSMTSVFPAIKWGTFIELLFVIGSLCVFFFGSKNPVVTSFATVFSGIVLEALPFMLLGALAGGIIEVAGDSPDAPSVAPVQTELRKNIEPAPLHVTILDLIKKPQQFQGKMITTEGMAIRLDTYSNDVVFILTNIVLPSENCIFRGKDLGVDPVAGIASI